MALSSERIDSIATLAGRLFADGLNLDGVVRGVREANPDLKTVTGAMAAVMGRKTPSGKERASTCIWWTATTIAGSSPTSRIWRPAS